MKHQCCGILQHDLNQSGELFFKLLQYVSAKKIMKIKKLYKYSDGNSIFRVLLSDTDKLIIETRDADKKEAYYQCLESGSGKLVFKNVQLDEKYWLGIEAIYKDIIFFHKYSKPDMPGHRCIIAFDINGKKIIWESEEYAFLFVYENLVYCYRQKFEGRDFYCLDYITGEVKENLGNDFVKINELKKTADDSKDYSNYLFPVIYDGSVIQDIRIKSIIDNYSCNLEIIGNIEYTVHNNLLLFNAHMKKEGAWIVNEFISADLLSGKIIFSELINTNLNAYAPDSFFIYKEKLFLLKDKKELLVYKLS